MVPTSAADAIGQAFTYTRTVLASPPPFRWARFWKLALLAAVTQSSFLSVSFTYPLQGAQLAFAAHTRHAADRFASASGAGWVGALGLGVLLVLGVVALLFILGYTYLLCRARATLFDLVVFRGDQVRAGWRRVGRAGLRYCGLYLVVMLVFLAALAAVLTPVILRAVRQASQGGVGTGRSPLSGSLMLTVVGLIWLLVPVLVVVDVLLQDFILPALVLDRAAPIRAAFARLGGLLRQAPGQVLLFIILRTVVALAVSIALGTVTLIAVGIVALISYGVGRLLYSALWSGSIAGHAVFFAAVAGMALVVALLYLVCITAVYGVTGTFKASYAAIFFAGYYPELAIALQGAPIAPPSAVLSATSAPPQLW